MDPRDSVFASKHLPEDDGVGNRMGAKLNAPPPPNGSIKKHLQKSGVGIQFRKCHICRVFPKITEPQSGQSLPFERGGHCN